MIRTSKGIDVLKTQPGLFSLKDLKVTFRNDLTNFTLRKKGFGLKEFYFVGKSKPSVVPLTTSNFPFTINYTDACRTSNVIA